MDLADPIEDYAADPSPVGKARRRLVRFVHRRPARVRLERPLVSFTFDDAPQTATDAGAAVLEARGILATYYVAAGLAGRVGPMGRDAMADDVRRVAMAGHEIACHTYSHLDCGQANAAAALADADRNTRALADWGVRAPENFAYPFGDVCAAAKQALGRRYRVLRALHHGLIEDGADLNQAPGVGIEGPGGEAAARHWLALAAERRAWLILYTHDVGPAPSPWGCTPQVLAGLADEARERGFDIVTVAEGARRIGA